MCPDPQRISRLPVSHRQRQDGFSIVSAIFLIVVLATLGALMVTFSTVQHATVAQDVQGARAYQAARAGVEWGLYRVLRPNSASCTGGAGTSLNFGGTLSGFAVTVVCEATGPVDDEGKNITHYTITATAANGVAVGAADYIERRVEVTLERVN